MSYYGTTGGGYYGESSHQSNQQRNPYEYSSYAGDSSDASTAWHSASTNLNQYHPVPQQQQQQQQQQQPNKPVGSQVSTGASVWNPAAAAVLASAMATGNQDALMQSAINAGQAFFKDSSTRWIPGLEATMIALRGYFAVDNRYVLRKMQKVLFPFLSKDWHRRVQHHGGPENSVVYQVPVDDENAPDLYLPSMSLITYVLLCAICYGTAGQFNPEVIPDATSKCFMTQVLEVLAIRLGFYLMQTPVPFLDLFAYTGYKYLGLCLNLMIGLVASHMGLGAKAYWLTFLWTASAMVFFMMKTMANNIPVQVSAQGPKREVVILVVAAAQCASMWFLGQTKFL